MPLPKDYLTMNSSLVLGCLCWMWQTVRSFHRCGGAKMLAVWANQAASMRMAFKLVSSQTKTIHGMKMKLRRPVYVRQNSLPAPIAFHFVAGGRIHTIRVSNKVGCFHIALLYRRLASMGKTIYVITHIHILKFQAFPIVINHSAFSFALASPSPPISLCLYLYLSQFNA